MPLDNVPVRRRVAVDAHAPRSVLDAPSRDARGASVFAISTAVLAHAALAGAALAVGARVVQHVAPEVVTQMIDVELPSPPQPAPPPSPADVPRTPAPRVRTRHADTLPEPAAPAAAQAGQVVSADEQVVDFGDTFVAGSASTYAGGVTPAQGTSQQAARDDRARPGGVTDGPGTRAAGDRSRAPQLAGGGHWDCPFPEEADAEGIDSAVVSLRVEVGSTGSVGGVTVLRDPGTGFGREARRCALRKRWSPALDRAGHATAAAAVVNVRFVR